LLFNGINLTPYLRIKSIRGRGLAPNSLTLIEVSGMDGAYFSKKRKPIRVIEIEVDIRANNREEIRKKITELNGLLSVKEPVPIVFPDEPEKTYFGIPEATDEGNEYTFLHQGTLTIICPDPYAYGEEQTVTFTNGEGSPNVKGTAKTLPIITAIFTGSATEFKISLDDQFVRVIRNFVAGDELIIDNVRKKILYNGNLAMPTLDLYSTWIELSPGAQTLTVEPTGVADVEMKYTERWL